MKSQKLLFFVNGPEKSAAGIRTQEFAKRLPAAWDIKVCYRPVRKWKGILPFVRAACYFRPHTIYVMDVAYTGVLAGCIAQKILKCKLIVDTGDVVYELAKSMGIYSPFQLALIYWVERLAMTNADCVVVRGSYHKSLLEKQGVRHVAFVPDGVDIKVIQPIDSISLRSTLEIANNLVVGMVGTMVWSARHRMCYGWDIVEALGILKGLPIKGLLVGDGDGRAILEKRVKELGIEGQVVFAGQIPYHKLPEYICAMDVCVSTQSNDLVGMVRTTGKLPLYLACGRYVVATDVGEAQNVLPGIGCLLPYSGVKDDAHPARLAEHLKAIMAKSSILKEAEAMEVVQHYFDYELLSHRVIEICDDLAE